MRKMTIIIAVGIYCVLTMSQASSIQAKQFTSVVLFKLHSPPLGRYSSVQFNSVAQSCLTLCDRGLQHTRLPIMMPILQMKKLGLRDLSHRPKVTGQEWDGVCSHSESAKSATLACEMATPFPLKLLCSASRELTLFKVFLWHPCLIGRLCDGGQSCSKDASCSTRAQCLLNNQHPCWLADCYPTSLRSVYSGDPLSQAVAIPVGGGQAAAEHTQKISS